MYKSLRLEIRVRLFLAEYRLSASGKHICCISLSLSLFLSLCLSVYIYVYICLFI